MLFQREKGSKPLPLRKFINLDADHLLPGLERAMKIRREEIVSLIFIYGERGFLRLCCFSDKRFEYWRKKYSTHINLRRAIENPVTRKRKKTPPTPPTGPKVGGQEEVWKKEGRLEFERKFLMIPILFSNIGMAKCENGGEKKKEKKKGRVSYFRKRGRHCAELSPGRGRGVAYISPV